MTFAEKTMNAEQIVDEMSMGALMSLMGYAMSEDADVLHDVDVSNFQTATNAFQSVVEDHPAQIDMLARCVSQNGAQDFMRAGYALMADRMGEHDAIPAHMHEDVARATEQVDLAPMMLVEVQGAFAVL